MGAFNGNVAHTIDPKGRATIPVTYRQELGETFTVGLNSETNALALYPQSQWEKIEQDLDRIPSIDARAMKYKRSILGFSFPGSQLDAQGRVLLPQTLRQKVGIDKTVRFVGVGTYIEIWPEEAFLAETDSSSNEREDLLEYVKERYYPAQ
ncbi:division/cell wall cluster transcriptional repressor MraZ [Eubacteriales bacterium OttesenSCG-928-N13]|nr:division/cell wall cluster transcriptional repressor MraZ [Eubacteriales bacterium OttesenSCG-928-N13]